MKSHLVLLILLTMFRAHAQVGGPLCFEYISYDAGEQFMNSKTSVDFPFTNCSNEPVIIERVMYKGERQDCIYNLPYHMREDTIMPGQKDTATFWKRTSMNFEPGFHQGLYIIRLTSGEEIPLELSVDLEVNHGQLSAEYVLIPTVNRGDTIQFHPRLKNIGTDPVTLRFGHIYSSFLRRTDDLGSPFTIMPGEEVVLGFELATQELLVEYKGVLMFESNEEGRYPRFQVEYGGKLISNNHPSIKFDSLVKHLYVDQYGDGSFEFWFENNGDAPLLIRTAKTSCGCMVANYPRQPIAPGERNVIMVRYDTKRLGPINKSVTVQTNIGSIPVMLRVKGMVYDPAKR